MGEVEEPSCRRHFHVGVRLDHLVVGIQHDQLQSHEVGAQDGDGDWPQQLWQPLKESHEIAAVPVHMDCQTHQGLRERHLPEE